MKTQLAKQHNKVVAAIQGGTRKLLLGGMMLGLLTGVCFAQRGSRQGAPALIPAPNVSTVAPDTKTLPATPDRSASRKGETVQPAVRDKTNVQLPYCATHPSDRHCQVAVK